MIAETQNRRYLFQPWGGLGLLVAASFLLKLLLLLARGDFLEYDESYYILLARNLFAGRGYVLNGLPHGAFPPLLPILIGVLTVVTRDAVFSSRLISALAGAFVILPVYGLGRELAGERSARLSALMVALLPPLNDLLNLGRTYRTLLYAGSEPLYLVLLLVSLLAAYRANGPRPRGSGFLSGLLLGAAFLVRPEAVLFLPVLLLWRSGWLGNRPAARLAGVSLTLAGFVLLALPYLIYLRAQAGQWVISEKLERGEDYRKAMYEVIEKNHWEDFARVRYALNPQGDGMASPYWGIASGRSEPAAASGRGTPDHRSGLHEGSEGGGCRPELRSGAPATARSENLFSALPARGLRNLALFLSVAPAVIFPVYLYPLAAMGLLAYLIPGGRKWRGKGMGGYLVLAFAPQAAIILFAYPVPRHHLLLTVVFSLWAGAGFDRVLAEVKSARWKKAAAGLLCLLLIAGNLRQLPVGSAGGRVRLESSATRDLARELKEGSRSGEAIMSWDPALAVWADRDWRVLPFDAEERIIAYARRVSARYLVFSRFAGFRYNDYFAALPPSIVFKIVDIAPASPSFRDGTRQVLEHFRGDQFVAWFRFSGESGKTER